MNIDIALAADRVRRSRAAVGERERARLMPRSTAGASARGALDVGARVFDLVTGQEGEIVGRTTQDVFVPAPDKRNG